MTRDVTKAHKVRLLTAAVCLACLLCAACQPAPDVPGVFMPNVTLDGVRYYVSPHQAIERELPRGFDHAGRCSMDGREYDAYTRGDIPEWVYVYQEAYDNVRQEPYMGYVRYVREDIRGRDFLRFDGKLYVSMWSDWAGDVDPELYDEIRGSYGIRMEGEPPAGFEYAGETVFEEQDRVPVGDLGSNTHTRAEDVYFHPDSPELLLVGTSWYTAPQTDPNSGGKEVYHEGYNVYLPYVGG